jgi:hypothetical protein
MLVRSQVLDLGEDVLTLVMNAHEETILQGIASTCRCLRCLCLPRLLEKKAGAVRDIYLTWA